MTPGYPEISLYVDGGWCKGAGGKTLPVLNPATGDAIGSVPVATRADLDRALDAADKGFQAWRKVSAYDRYKLMRKAADIAARPRRRHRQNHDAGAGQAVGRGQGRDPGSAPTSSTGSPRKAAAPMAASFRRAPRASTSSSSRSRSGRSAAFTPWNFPINQAVRKISAAIGRRLLDHRQGAGGDAGQLRRARPRLCRCRRAGGRDQPRLRRAGGNLGIPHPASGHPQDLVHRLDRGGQASRRARRAAHEARDHGAGRPRAGHRVRRRRSRRGGQDPVGQQVPQRRPGLRLADAFSGAGEASMRRSSRNSSPRPRR